MKRMKRLVEGGEERKLFESNLKTWLSVSIVMSVFVPQQRQRRMQQQKLTKDFETALKSFKEVENLKMQKERQAVSRARAHSRAAGEMIGLVQKDGSLRGDSHVCV